MPEHGSYLLAVFPVALLYGAGVAAAAAVASMLAFSVESPAGDGTRITAAIPLPH